MKVRLPGILAAVFVFGAAVPTFAHHGFTVEFDPSNCMDVRGTLTGVTWENPHAYIDVAEKGRQWQGRDVAPGNGYPERSEKERHL